MRRRLKSRFRGDSAQDAVGRHEDGLLGRAGQLADPIDQRRVLIVPGRQDLRVFAEKRHGVPEVLGRQDSRNDQRNPTLGSPELLQRVTRGREHIHPDEEALICSGRAMKLAEMLVHIDAN